MPSPTCCAMKGSRAPWSIWANIRTHRPPSRWASLARRHPQRPGARDRASAARSNSTTWRLAVSGGYGTTFEPSGRFHHIFDPHTGASANRLVDVAVIGPRRRLRTGCRPRSASPARNAPPRCSRPIRDARDPDTAGRDDRDARRCSGVRQCRRVGRNSAAYSAGHARMRRNERAATAAAFSRAFRRSRP